VCSLRFGRGCLLTVCKVNTSNINAYNHLELKLNLQLLHSITIAEYRSTMDFLRILVSQNTGVKMRKVK